MTKNPRFNLPTNSAWSAMMEIKSSITTIFLLFLILLTVPSFSRGGSEMEVEVYQIDYRGPETHSSTPPPGHSRGKPMLHRKNKFKGSRGTGNMGEKAKKIHG
ncbi:uncharacterized protein LOC132162531 [Corylus avellana]|uniref:uncharacterized protein LOC132162531 n=1 Tax=Corylus avellana TaxID=13451 RepID=UPI001E23CE08|nr:uncharacterized protein LOC132162531 [Corylus avellana]